MVQKNETEITELIKKAVSEIDIESYFTNRHDEIDPDLGIDKEEIRTIAGQIMTECEEKEFIVYESEEEEEDLECDIFKEIHEELNFYIPDSWRQD